MAELQNKQRPQVAASACKIIDKSALSAQFPPPTLSACSSGPPSASDRWLSAAPSRPRLSPAGASAAPDGSVRSRRFPAGVGTASRSSAAGCIGWDGVP